MYRLRIKRFAQTMRGVKEYQVIIEGVDNKFYASYYPNKIVFNGRDMLLYITNSKGQSRFIGDIERYVLLNSIISVKGFKEDVTLEKLYNDIMKCKKDWDDLYGE